MGFHDEIEDEGLHVPGYVQVADPGAIGAGKEWMDTSLGTGNWVIKRRNAGNTGWETPVSAPTSHTHLEADITDLGSYANIAHTHLEEDITDLGSYAAASHSHTESDITDLDHTDDDAFHKNSSGDVDSLTAKTAPVAGDYLILQDGEDGDAWKKLDIDDLPSGGSSFDPAVIPHYNKGTGVFSVLLINGLTIEVGAQGSSSGKVTPRDFIHTMSGGVASPSYSFRIRRAAGTWTSTNSDPTVPTLTFEGDEAGTVFVEIEVSDGTTTRACSTYIAIEGTAGAP